MYNDSFENIIKSQATFYNSPLIKTVQQLQQIVDNIKLPYLHTTMLPDNYQEAVLPLMDNINCINRLYASILNQTKPFDRIYNKPINYLFNTNTTALSQLLKLNIYEIKNISSSLINTNSLYENISFETVSRLYENNDITDEDISKELCRVLINGKPATPEENDEKKKAKLFLAIKILWIILSFMLKPVIEKVSDDILDNLGIKQFWSESGIYEILDNINDSYFNKISFDENDEFKMLK